MVVLRGGNSRWPMKKETGRHTHYTLCHRLGESWQIREFLWLPFLLPFDGQINSSRRCFCAAFWPRTSPQTSSNVLSYINRHRFRAHMGVRVVSGHSSPCTRFCCSPLYPFSPSTAPAVSPRPIFFVWGLLGPDPARIFFQVLPLLIITSSHPRTDNLYT